jgi:hypothetical protein
VSLDTPTAPRLPYFLAPGPAFLFQQSSLQTIDDLLRPDKLPTREYFIHAAIECIGRLLALADNERTIVRTAATGEQELYHPLRGRNRDVKVASMTETNSMLVRALSGPKPPNAEGPV